MDAKMVARKGEDLSKATSASEPASTLLPMLSELRSGVKASEEILRSTKIGIIVNKLKTHSDSQVAQAAAQLVNKWRSDIKSGSKSKGSPAPAAGKMDVDKKDAKKEDAKKDAAASGNNTAAAADKSKKSSVDPSKRNAQVDGVSIAQTGDSTRDSCFKLMYDGLAFMSTEPSSRIQPLALAIEAAAYKNLCPQDSATDAYKQKMRSLFMNLKSKTSPHLREGILAQPPTIAPERLVKMTPDELKSPERRAEDAKIQKENMDKAMVAQVEKSISASLQCGRCKQKKVSYSQAQTRSADEPMTTFCECTVCGNRWKFS